MNVRYTRKATTTVQFIQGSATYRSSQGARKLREQGK